MKIEFELNGHAESAYESVLEALEEEHGTDMGKGAVAESVLREYIASQYNTLIIEGSNR